MTGYHDRYAPVVIRDLADRLDAQAGRYELAAESAERRVGGRSYHGDDIPWVRAVGLNAYYAHKATRLRIAAEEIRRVVER